MRVTSPPKHHSQFQRVNSPLRNQSNLSNISNQMQRSFHPLKSPQRTGPYKAQNSSMKQSLYAELRNRELQCGQIISQLNKENNSLKAELGKVHVQQPKKVGYTTVMSTSPQKIDLNRSIGNHHSEHFNAPKLDHNRAMNHTFSGFHPQIVQHPNIITVRPNSSPFSKKPVILGHSSPLGFRPQVVTVVSPNKRTVRPVSNLVQISNPITIRSPQKRQVNHSYQPSLISFKYPSQQQSLDCSPKKSFQSIIGLDSQIFSNTNNSQYQPEPCSHESDQAPNSNFFDMKKRQLNYGSVFEKEKNNSSSKSIHTTLKMSTKHLLENQVEPKITIDKQNDQDHLNPLSTKRPKKEKSSEEKMTQPEQQITKEFQCKKFNLEENIDKNPLLSMLKKRLQQQVNVLNAFTNESESLQAVSLFEQTPKNPNIRYSRERSEPIQSNYITHPLKRNMFQAFPLLHQLRAAQPTTNEEQAQQVQQIQQVVENQVNIQNQNTKGSLRSNNQKSRSRLSDKVSRENTSELIIQQILEDQNAHRPMTIVRMLDETKRMVTDDQDDQKDEEQFINQDDEEVSPTTYLIGVNRESFDQENENEDQEYQFYEGKIDCEDEEQERQQQNADNIMISNRYYCQNTEQNQSIHSSSLKHLHQLEPDQIISKKTLRKNTQNVLIYETQNIQKIVTSKQSINSIQRAQTPSKQTLLNCTENPSQKLSQAQSSPCKFYDNPNQTQFYDNPNQTQSQKAQQTQSQNAQQTQSQNAQQTQSQNAQQTQSQNAQQNLTLNKSAQYDTFYVQKTNKTFQTQNKIQFNGVKAAQRYQESRISDTLTQNSLRSHRFKKISNRAYL